MYNFFSIPQGALATAMGRAMGVPRASEGVWSALRFSGLLAVPYDQVEPSFVPYAALELAGSLPGLNEYTTARQGVDQLTRVYRSIIARCDEYETTPEVTAALIGLWVRYDTLVLDLSDFVLGAAEEVGVELSDVETQQLQQGLVVMELNGVDVGDAAQLVAMLLQQQGERATRVETYCEVLARLSPLPVPLISERAGWIALPSLAP